MTVLDKDTRDMIDVQTAMLKIVNQMVDDGVNPLVVAAMMSNISMQMYKTTLSDDDYNAMVDYISANRSRIQAFNTNENLH